MNVESRNPGISGEGRVEELMWFTFRLWGRMGKKICCHLKGYSKAAAAWTAVETTFLSFDTSKIRRSRRRAWSSASRESGGRYHNRSARGMPAFHEPLPVSGGICSSTKSLVLQERPRGINDLFERTDAGSMLLLQLELQ